MMDGIVLEPEQEELFGVLVEASRAVPRDRRQKFIAFQNLGNALAKLAHPGVPKVIQVSTLAISRY